MIEEYDVVIVGGGPAGLTAGLYTSRARLNSVLIEMKITGGQMAEAVEIENYPGFPQGISGFELGELMYQQATKFGLKTVATQVTAIEIGDRKKTVKTANGDFPTKAVIIASGSERRRLLVPGEKEFTGKGVSYCAICDADFFRDLPVAVVGGGNAAIGEALHLSKFASKVTVIHRRKELRATRIVQEKAFAEPKIEFAWDSVVEAIEGDELVRAIKLRQVKTEEISNLSVDGIFISIGFIPNTDYLKGIVSLADNGAVVTNENLETNVPGIFAAGDVRQKVAWQVITAAGDGATAAIHAERFIVE
jgi:thioredoxin reductase (NADPH)